MNEKEMYHETKRSRFENTSVIYLGKISKPQREQIKTRKHTMAVYIEVVVRDDRVRDLM